MFRSGYDGLFRQLPSLFAGQFEEGEAVERCSRSHRFWSRDYGVAGDYFRTMGFSLRAGRFLTAADSHRLEQVCVVDEDFARYYWPNGSAIGQRLWDGSATGKDAEAFTVVGVVGGVKQAGLTEDEAQARLIIPMPSV